jgi:hypothetical protein
MFTSHVDKAPNKTRLELPSGLTKVSVADFDAIRFVNFEATINFPEDEGIIQIECFGMHLNVDGSFLYGMKVEAIMDRQADGISVDLLSRLLVDVTQDSSAISSDLTSTYQKAMLELVFLGDPLLRPKYNVIMAERIKPFATAEQYLDRAEHENELKQVLGAIERVYVIDDANAIILGRDGLLFAGPQWEAAQEVLVAYGRLLAREVFIRNVFARLFILDEELKKVRKMIADTARDQSLVGAVRRGISQANKDAILLGEVLNFILKSIEKCDANVDIISTTPAPVVALTAFLKLEEVRAQLKDRVKDLAKLIHGIHSELGNLLQLMETVSTQQLESVFKNVVLNTKSLVILDMAAERSAKTYEALQIILGANLAFAIIDRIGGVTLGGMEVPEWVQRDFLDFASAYPWFLVFNLGWLVGFSVLLMAVMRLIARNAPRYLSFSTRMNQAMDVGMLDEYLSNKRREESDVEISRDQVLVKAIWYEKDRVVWQGAPPRIEMLYDSRSSYILSVTFRINTRRNKLREDGLFAVFERILLDHNIISASDEDEKKFFARLLADNAVKL